MTAERSITSTINLHMTSLPGIGNTKNTWLMTANWARLPYDVLATISTRIINEVRGTSRVAYDISGKPPATIEWE